MMTVAPDGTVYVTQPEAGNVLALRDGDGDGTIAKNERKVVVSDMPTVHGLLLRDRTLYLVQPETMSMVKIRPRGRYGKPVTIMKGLPSGGQHPKRTLGLGPDGMLYISVGSSCNACEESNKEHATMLRAKLGQGDRKIFAKGLRNTIGFGWHPVTRQMWGMDHGSDHRGNDTPPEELNLLEEGKDYGWPFVYGKQQPDSMRGEPPGYDSIEAYARTTQPAVLTYQAHSAPIGLLFYTGDQFPEDYRNDAFVTFRGSWNRAPATGYKLVRVVFDDAGQPQRFEDFMTSFLTRDGTSHFGRIAGLAQYTDGSLLLSEDTGGVIYRIRYREPRP